MKKGVKIGIAIAAGVLGYFVVTNWDKIKDKLQGKGSGKDDIVPDQGDAVSTTPTTNGGPSEYEQKVSELQGLLGVSIDGKPGKQTNGQLEYMYDVALGALDAEKAFTAGYPNLKKWGYGIVSPSNVKNYIYAVKNAVTPRQLTPLRRRLETIWSSVTTMKPGTIMKDTSVPFVYLDTISDDYKETGGYVTIPAGTKFYQSALKRKVWSNVTLVLNLYIPSQETWRSVRFRTYQLNDINI